MDKFSASVRWGDGTNDFSRICDTCEIPDCKAPTHKDYYKEIVGEAYRKLEGLPGQAFVEPLQANPDQLIHDPLENLMCEEDGAVLEAATDLAFEKLTKPQKELWDLCMRQGITITEAAERMGISQPAASQMLTRAKAVFTAALREQQ